MAPRGPHGDTVRVHGAAVGRRAPLWVAHHGDDVVHVGEVVGVQEGAQLLRARRHIPVAVGGAEAALIAGRHAGVALRIRVRTQRGVWGDWGGMGGMEVVGGNGC